MNHNVIEHIVEPSKLLLVWQGPEGSSRARHVVGELLSDGDRTMMLRYTSDIATLQAAMRDGFQGHPAFKDLTKTHSSGVAEAFLRRIPPRSRGDFGAYLAQLRLPIGASLSDFALLGYSGGRLPTDGFSVIHTFEDHIGPFEFVTEVAGFRHQAPKAGVNASDLIIGEVVTFNHETDNPTDDSAVQVVVREKVIGYVMRGLQKPMCEWLRNRRIDASIDRINGRPERPAVYIFVRVGPHERASTWPNLQSARRHAS